MASQNKHLALGTRLNELFPEKISPASDSSASTPRRVRWKVTSSAIIVTLGVVLLVAILLWTSAGGATPVSTLASPKVSVQIHEAATGAARSSSSGSSNNPSGGSSDASVLIIHIVGAVARPGVLRLAPGSRVYQAIAAAGGALPTAASSALNLAAAVQDGQQLLVPTAAQLKAGGFSGQPLPALPTLPIGKAGAVAAAGKLNLNAATAEQLVSLPRVGQVLAQRIVQWRNEHGEFRTPNELDSVPGIGSKMLEALLPLVTI